MLISHSIPKNYFLKETRLNLIKYLPVDKKEICPICNHQLKRDYPANEIYCSHCGMLFLSYAPMTNRLIDIGLSFDDATKKCLK